MPEIIVTSKSDLKELITQVFQENKETVKRFGTDNVPPNEKKMYYTRKEVSKELNITLLTLTKYVKNGLIKCHRIGSRVLFKREDIDNAIVQRKFK